MENIKYKKNLEDVFIACPHCMVCSLKLSAEEYAIVKAGQQMVEVCSVCGKTINIQG